MVFCSLYSGSSGNSTYIESSSTRLLVDAGVSCQKISKALDELGSSLNSIDGILISHEHSDHIKGIEVISKKIRHSNLCNQKNLGCYAKFKSC